jgi:prepilin-type N-terminal cleavage/methylation domain-containing protein/prepilin-type processing-associated H-X9-DG protein
MRRLVSLRRAFTLIEVLVVIAVITVLIALLLPAVQSAREAGRRAQCLNNLKQMGLAIANYETTSGAYPVGAISYYEPYNAAVTPLLTPKARQHTMFSFLLPHLDQSPLFNAINFSVSSYDDPVFAAPGGTMNSTAFLTRLSVYICPSDASQISQASGTTAYSQCSYAGMVGTNNLPEFNFGFPPCCGVNSIEIEPNGVFGKNFTISLSQVTDGTSSTIFIGEMSRFKNDPEPYFNEWNRQGNFSSSVPALAAMLVTRPQVLATSVPRINADLQVPSKPSGGALNYGSGPPYGPFNWQHNPAMLDKGQLGFRSQHPGGANFLFGDGSVKFLKETMDLMTYRYLSTKDGQEPISADAY